MSFIRLFVLAAAAIALSCAPAFADAPKATVKLRAAPTVSGDTINIGDIFDGAGAEAATKVLPAPRPGQSILIETHSLCVLLAAHGLGWQEATGVPSIRVERLARQVQAPEIANAVASALSQQSGRTLEAHLQQQSLVLEGPPAFKDAPQVEVVDFDTSSGRFEANVRIPGGDGAHVSGVADEVMDVPVLARSIQRGEIIADADIIYVHARIDALSRTVVTDPKDLIGLSAKRPMRSGQPIQVSDIEHAAVVAKGALVTIVYEVPGLTLTDQGRALEGGAIGETISVLNPSSHRTLLATVIASDRVRLEATSLAGASLAQR